MLRFHNAVVADVKASLAGLTLAEVFAEAQRIVRWHYQWMIVHQFLPKTVGTVTMADLVANGRKLYDWRHDPYIPVEFSVAAYRFGHSQVRPSYRANFGTSATELVHIGQAVMGCGGTVEYLVDAVFNYPTFSEAYKVAALDVMNKLRALNQFRA